MLLRLIVLAMLVVALSKLSYAEPVGDIGVQLEVFRIVRAADGRESALPANSASPGDLLEYRAQYRNRGKTLAKDVEALLPIPADGVSYVQDSAQPQAVMASTDGQSFNVVPLRRSVVLADGRREMQPVPLAQYRFLRWKIGDLPAAGVMTVKARVRVTALEAVQAAKGANDVRR